MAESWGNDAATRYNEDLVSDPKNKNILKVNDVNDNDDAKIAIHAINSSTNANARALKVEGSTEINKLLVDEVSGRPNVDASALGS